MKIDTKTTLKFFLILVRYRFLYFHAFIFSIIYYTESLDIPLFIILHSMWFCFSRIVRYMPSSMHAFMSIAKSVNKLEKPSLPIYFEALAWKSIIAGIYYHLNLRFLLIQKLSNINEGVTSKLGGYGAYFASSRRWYCVRCIQAYSYSRKHNSSNIACRTYWLVTSVSLAEKCKGRQLNNSAAGVILRDVRASLTKSVNRSPTEVSTWWDFFQVSYGTLKNDTSFPPVLKLEANVRTMKGITEGATVRER
jgi:hypothetical protein